MDCFTWTNNLYWRCAETCVQTGLLYSLSSPSLLFCFVRFSLSYASLHLHTVVWEVWWGERRSNKNKNDDSIFLVVETNTAYRVLPGLSSSVKNHLEFFISKQHENNLKLFNRQWYWCCERHWLFVAVLSS